MKLPSLTWGTGSLIWSATGKMYEKTPTENVTLVVEHWNHHIVTEHINYASLNSFELYTSWAIASNKLLGFPQDLWLSKRGSRLQKWPQKIWVVKVLVRWKLTCPLNMLVGRCIPYWNVPLLGDIFVLRGVCPWFWSKRVAIWTFYWLVDKGVVNLKIVFCFVGFTDSTKSLVVIIVVISTQTLGQMIQFDEFTFQMGGSTSIPKQSDLKFQDSYRTTWVIHWDPSPIPPEFFAQSLGFQPPLKQWVLI